MKKFLCIILAILMILPVALFTGCNSKETTKETNKPADNTPAEELKLGLGIYSYFKSATDATEDTNGAGTVVLNAAAVLVDANGKVVKCDIDTLEASVAYTADGKYVAPSEFLSKREQGNDYNMIAYGGAAKEWFDQVDAFEKAIVGKTVGEIKALVATDNKGTQEVITAGCTIKINEFVLAIEKATINAKASKATADDNLKVAIAASASGNDYSVATVDGEEVVNKGSAKVEMNVSAVATNGKGVITAVSTDCAEASFSFDDKGAALTDTAATIMTKHEKGANYGMVEYAKADKEWFEQANILDTACVGKNYNGVKELVADNGKGIESVVTAGCTITISGLVNAILKAAK